PYAISCECRASSVLIPASPAKSRNVTFWQHLWVKHCAIADEGRGCPYAAINPEHPEGLLRGERQETSRRGAATGAARIVMDAKPIIKANLPSRHVTVGPERAPHRSYLYAMGLSREEIAQPLVGVASCWNEAAPCNISLMRQAQVVKKGVAAANGTPREFCTITVTDGI